MTDVDRRAVQERKLDRAPTCERDRLAVYILSLGNSLDDPHRMLDRVVRMHRRVAPREGESSFTANASTTFE